MATPTIRKSTDEGITQIKSKSDRYYGYYRAYRTAPPRTHQFTRGPQAGQLNQTSVKVWCSKRFKDYDEAKAWVQQASHEVAATAPSDLTVGKYLEDWLGRQATSGTKQGYRRRDASVAAYGRHLSRAYGVHHLRLTALSRVHLETLYAALVEGTAVDDDGNRIKGSSGGGLKAEYVRQIHKTLRTALDDAVERGLLVTNPAVGKVSLPGIDEDTEFEAHVITDTELALLLESADRDREGCLVSLILTTGLRRSEACNLRWSTVFIDQKETEPRLYVAKTEDFTPKSKKSSRRVDVSTAIADRLRNWRLVHDPSEFVFGHNGTALTPKQAESIWNRVRTNTEEIGRAHV